MFINVTSLPPVHGTDIPLYDCLDSYPGRIFTCSCLLLNIITLSPLNVWILWLERRGKNNAGRCQLYLCSLTVNLAAMEIFTEMCFLLYILADVVSSNSVMLVSTYLSGGFMVGRPFCQSCICLERYLAVVHPVVYLRFKAPRYKSMCVFFVWCTTLTFGTVITVHHPHFPVNYFAGIFSTMLLTMTTCSLLMLWTLKRSRPGEGDREGMHQSKRKAFFAITSILVTVVMGYVPFLLLFVMRMELAYHAFCLGIGIGFWIMVPSSIVHPLLYFCKVKNWHVPRCRDLEKIFKVKM